MATTNRWALRSSTPTTALSTELNALANNAGAISTAAIAQTTPDMYGDFELLVTFTVAPTAAATVDLYIVETVDGTNYEDWGTSSTPVPPANGYVGSFVLEAKTTLHRKQIHGALLPPTAFKLVAVNKSGQAFPATGSTITALLYSEQSA